MSARHGTRSRYAAGCRCADCRLACARYAAELRADLAGQPIPDDAHGRLGTYTNRGCRCDLCRTAKRNYRVRRTA